MPTLTIDGQRVTVPEGATILDAARAAGVHIPTLCHHEALEPWGGCRMCIVDMWKPGWDEGLVQTGDLVQPSSVGTT
jgi:bidirectional [NiFe] hydrogenase diaphorase subunit